METFQNIHYDLSKLPGRLRVAESGMGWKGKNSDDALTLESGSINGAQWSRGSRGWEMKILSRNQGVILLDGFAEEVRYPPCAQLVSHAYRRRISIA